MAHPLYKHNNSVVLNTSFSVFLDFSFERDPCWLYVQIMTWMRILDMPKKVKTSYHLEGGAR